MVLSFCQGWFVCELKKLLKVAIPASLSMLFQFTPLWFSLFFLGHLPEDPEDTGQNSNQYLYPAAGLGSAFLAATGVVVGHGLATAADTLSSQAYGYKNYKKVGVILQRGILILGLVMFPIWAVWLNTESLLLLVQQPPCVAKFSGLYVELFTLALPFIFLYILLQHYLQAQSIVWQFALIGFISNCVCVILHAITIYGIGLGYIGAVVSLVISNILPPLMVIVYVWCRKLHKETWGGWSFQALEEWGVFMKLAVPGFLMVGMSWMSFEIGNFVSGALGETELSVNIVWYQLLEILYMPVFGVSIATSVRVGNELGAGNPRGAKRASYVSVVVVLLYAILCSTFLLATKDVISLAFLPGNTEVAEEVSKLMNVASAFVVVDFVHGVLGGMLRGSGGQVKGAITNFIGFYIISLPVGISLAFKTSLRVIGIWIGFLVGKFVMSAILLLVLISTNWEKAAQKAMERAQQFSSAITRVEATDSEERTIVGTDILSQEDCKEADTDNLFSDMEIEENPHGSDRTLTRKTWSSSQQFSSAITRVGASDIDREERIESTMDADILEDCGEELDTDDLLSDMEIKEETLHNERTLLQRTWSYKVRKLLIHSILCIIGAGVLIAGGVSSRYHPHVDPEEYYNCTTYENSSLLAIDKQDPLLQ